MKTLKTVSLLLFIIPFLFSCTENKFEGKWKCIDASYSIEQDKLDLIMQMDEELREAFEEGMSNPDNDFETLKNYRLEFLDQTQALEIDPITNFKYESVYSIKDKRHIQIGKVVYIYKWIDKDHFNLTQSILDGSFSITMKMERGW